MIAPKPSEYELEPGGVIGAWQPRRHCEINQDVPNQVASARCSPTTTQQHVCIPKPPACKCQLPRK